MKIVANDKSTWIYPFLEPEGEIRTSTAVVVFKGGRIEIYRGELSGMDTHRANALVQALLYAVELVEKER